MRKNKWRESFNENIQERLSDSNSSKRQLKKFLKKHPRATAIGGIMLINYLGE